MIFYFQKKVESACAGTRVASVTCDKCNCQYFYELARIGAGSGVAPYGIGTESATGSAQERAQKELQQRMAVEAELVPCPECHWTNDHLIQGYRLGRYRRVGTLALGIAIVGSIGSLIGAWIISVGPPADRGALPYFRIGGPILFMSIGAWMVLYRNWRRNRIQPNRDYPLPPRVPPGTPPALTRDELTGQLRPAPTENQDLAETSDWIYFQVGRQMLPWLCCGCLQNADAQHTLIIEESGLVGFEVPRCADCTRNERLSYWCFWFSTMVLSLLTTMAAIALLRLETAESYAVMVFCLLPAFALASYVASTLTAPVRVASADKTRGVVRLRFRNAEYGQAVAESLSHPSGGTWSAGEQGVGATVTQTSLA